MRILEKLICWITSWLWPAVRNWLGYWGGPARASPVCEQDTQDTQNTPVLPLQPWLPDIPDPGWPEHALPVMYRRPADQTTEDEDSDYSVSISTDSDLVPRRQREWPDDVLPRVSIIPERFFDDPGLEPCQCLAVPHVVPPLGPFSSYARCFECLKPVVSLENAPEYCRWQWFVYKYLQRWNRNYWSDLPSVRVQRLEPWWEEYASYKYRRPAREPNSY